MTICICVLILVAHGCHRPKRGPDKPAVDHATNSQDADLPSEATVDAFLHQHFGYQPDLTWKISSIKPSIIPGLAEVNVVLASQQGQQFTRFYVSQDGKHALVGDIIPFGARPFDPVKKALDKGVTGPSRGPKDANGHHCGVWRLAMSRLQNRPADRSKHCVAAEPKAHFVFQNFPLEMHNWAAKGADYADCVGRASNDAFWKFVAKTYEPADHYHRG